MPPAGVPLLTATASVVFSQPASASATLAPRAMPPAPLIRERRVTRPDPEGPFKACTYTPALSRVSSAQLYAWRAECPFSRLRRRLRRAVAQHAMRRVVAGRRDHAAARVRARAAEVEPVDRRRVARQLAGTGA